VEITVIIATFGSEAWRQKGLEAFEKALHWGADDVIQAHAPDLTLAESRNWAAEGVETEWICFVDADDDLAPGYIEAMKNADGPNNALLAPALCLAGEMIPLEDRDIQTMNPCAIGTVLRKEDFLRAGGFWEERAWEDWSLFRRCWLLGCPVVHVKGAIYVANSTPTGRNATVENPEQLHKEIVASHVKWLAKT
jgi:glycosyltransferase involved in cell wall biosynthesis